MIKELMELKQSKEGYMGKFGVKKEKKGNETIIISKRTENRLVVLGILNMEYQIYILTMKATVSNA